MSYRGRIHINKIDQFRDYLVKNNWVLQNLRSPYEVIRAKRNKKIVIFYNRDKSDHLSCADNHCYIAEKFLKELL